MWYTKNFFRYTVGAVLVLLIIYLLIQIFTFLSIFLQFVSTILIPLVAAGVLYYILRPLRQFLENKKIPRLGAIGLIFLTTIITISLVCTVLWPFVNAQVKELVSFPREKFKEFENKTMDIMNIFNYNSVSQDQLRQTLIVYLQKITEWILSNIITNISSITKVASFFIITPFILFYFLKDDQKMSSKLIKEMPYMYDNETKKILNTIDETLSSFITSQLIVASIVAVLIFIGYLIIGLNYAFFLALLVLVFNMIPFCGPLIATIPALFIGLADSPAMGVKVICVVLIVHLLDLNLISPRVVGQRLNIHPITIVLLLISSIYLFGFLSLFIIIPLYAVIKSVIVNIYDWNIAPKESH